MDQALGQCSVRGSLRRWTAAASIRNPKYKTDLSMVDCRARFGGPLISVKPKNRVWFLNDFYNIKLLECFSRFVDETYPPLRQISELLDHPSHGRDVFIQSFIVRILIPKFLIPPS